MPSEFRGHFFLNHLIKRTQKSRGQNPTHQIELGWANDDQDNPTHMHPLQTPPGAYFEPC
jgi:hypothetical protein